ncbi:hypothetical protein Ancab_005464 [Ancistrocladus abbreviatus]
MEMWSEYWDPNRRVKKAVFQVDSLLLSKIGMFDQTFVQPIASRGGKILVLIICGVDMHLQLALVDLCSRKVKPICSAMEGHEFDGEGNMSRFTSSYTPNMWGYFDVLCHVSSLLQLP